MRLTGPLRKNILRTDKPHTASTAQGAGLNITIKTRVDEGWSRMTRTRNGCSYLSTSLHGSGTIVMPGVESDSNGFPVGIFLRGFRSHFPVAILAQSGEA